MTSKLYLCEAITTRLSHDLIGNAGAVANAMELIGDGNGDDLDDILPALEFSALTIMRRLKFFRLCFGLSNASVKNLDELKQVVDDYLATLGNPKMPITAEIEVDTPKIHKLIMPSVMLMADLIVKGGTVTVKQTENALITEAHSPFPISASKLANISRILNGEQAEDNPSAYAPLYYLSAYLEGAEVNIKLDGAALIIGD